MTFPIKHLTHMQKRVILLKLLVGVGLAYNHFYPQHSPVGLITNLLWLMAF